MWQPPWNMEALYASCGASGRLAGESFDFMKAPLTFDDVLGAKAKVATQPYVPPSVGVTGASVFPSAA